jgi:hypothetical protein
MTGCLISVHSVSKVILRNRRDQCSSSGVKSQGNKLQNNIALKCDNSLWIGKPILSRQLINIPKSDTTGVAFLDYLINYNILLPIAFFRKNNDILLFKRKQIVIDSCK